MSQDNLPWNKLISAARKAPQEGDVSVPYGFATRIAALAMAEHRPRISLFARYSLRALGVACLLAVVSVAANYSSITAALDNDQSAISDDPVDDAVDVAS